MWVTAAWWRRRKVVISSSSSSESLMVGGVDGVGVTVGVEAFGGEVVV